MSVAALIAIGALLVWAFGSITARLVGALIIFEGLLRIGFTGPGPLSVAILAIGVAAWLLGHWIWAYKHKIWRTRLALNVYSLPGLHRLAPIVTNRQPWLGTPRSNRDVSSNPGGAGLPISRRFPARRGLR
ncbi:putative membrane protein (plasmid) [Rhodococcus opacus]|uniref:Putative membrane protein n=1 Tax=Rhodococcus opacus TaxID=37919 RepID=A0A1B1KJ97_RHOOP|nr:putative membrane protein [Rhodococcus opacus]